MRIERPVWTSQSELTKPDQVRAGAVNFRWRTSVLLYGENVFDICQVKFLISNCRILPKQKYAGRNWSNLGGLWGVSPCGVWGFPPPPQRTSCCAHLKSLTFHINRTWRSSFWCGQCAHNPDPLSCPSISSSLHTSMSTIFSSGDQAFLRLRKLTHF
jgi:hypothetical protein